MKKILTAALIVSIVFLTGCFNITEELFLEKDGSGSFSTTLEFNKLDEIIKMMKQLSPDDDQSAFIKSSLTDTLNKLSLLYKDIPGITDIETVRPDSSSIIIRFKFKNLQALNTALKKRMENEQGEIFAYDQNTFVCNDKSLADFDNALAGANKQKPSSMPNGMEMPEINPEQIKGMFNMLGWDITKKTIFHLPKPITEFSNKDAVLSADKKTITLDVNLLNDYKSKTLENRIKLQ